MPTKNTAATSWQPRHCWTRRNRIHECRTSSSAAWSRPLAGSWTCGASWTSHDPGLSSTHCFSKRYWGTLHQSTLTLPAWRKRYVTNSLTSIELTLVFLKYSWRWTWFLAFSDHYYPGCSVWHQHEEGRVWVSVLHRQAGVSGRQAEGPSPRAV